MSAVGLPGTRGLQGALLMNLPFGAGLDPGEPVTPETAVRRGHMFVSVPAVALMLGASSQAIPLTRW